MEKVDDRVAVAAAREAYAKELSDDVLLEAYAVMVASVASLRCEIETRMLDRPAVAIPDDKFLKVREA